MTAAERLELRQAIDREKRRRLTLAGRINQTGLVELPEPGTLVGGRCNGTNVRHGTEQAYTRYQCRCEACKKASSIARRERRWRNIERSREVWRAASARRRERARQARTP